MHGTALDAAGLWSGKAYFGRQGLDDWEHFLVTAVLARPTLPPTEDTGGSNPGIKPEQWKKYWDDHRILAESPPIQAQRITSPFDPRTSVRLKITTIGDQSVDDQSEWPVAPLSGIEVSIEGEVVQGEVVRLYSESNRAPGKAVYLGSATPTSRHSWEMRPVRLGEIGQHFNVFAALTSSRSPQLGDERPGTGSRVVTSRPISIVLTGGMRLQITQIGGQSVDAVKGVTIHGPVMVDLSLSGRFFSGDEKVLLYSRPAGATGPWKLIGQALRRARGEQRQWQLLPVLLGQPGEHAMVIAVVARNRSVSLTDDDLGNVLALGGPVTVVMQ
jgi:hypothetical protein